MPGRPKSDWKTKMDELKAKLPEKFDARAFRGCKEGGKYDKAKVAKVCEDNGIKDKVDSVMAFLAHKETKPAGKKRGPRKAKSAAQEKGSVNLLAKRTYSELKYDDFDKLIAMLTEMKKDAKAKKIEAAKAKKDAAEKELKDLLAK